MARGKERKRKKRVKKRVRSLRGLDQWGKLLQRERGTYESLLEAKPLLLEGNYSSNNKYL